MSSDGKGSAVEARSPSEVNNLAQGSGLQLPPGTFTTAGPSPSIISSTEQIEGPSNLPITPSTPPFQKRQPVDEVIRDVICLPDSPKSPKAFSEHNPSSTHSRPPVLAAVGPHLISAGAPCSPLVLPNHVSTPVSSDSAEQDLYIPASPRERCMRLGADEPAGTSHAIADGEARCQVSRGGGESFDTCLRERARMADGFRQQSDQVVVMYKNSKRRRMTTHDPLEWGHREEATADGRERKEAGSLSLGQKVARGGEVVGKPTEILKDNNGRNCFFGGNKRAEVHSVIADFETTKAVDEIDEIEEESDTEDEAACSKRFSVAKRNTEGRKLHVQNGVQKGIPNCSRGLVSARSQGIEVKRGEEIRVGEKASSSGEETEGGNAEEERVEETEDEDEITPELGKGTSLCMRANNRKGVGDRDVKKGGWRAIDRLQAFDLPARRRDVVPESATDSEPLESLRKRTCEPPYCQESVQPARVVDYTCNPSEVRTSQLPPVSPDPSSPPTFPPLLVTSTEPNRFSNHNASLQPLSHALDSSQEDLLVSSKPFSASLKAFPRVNKPDNQRCLTDSTKGATVRILSSEDPSTPPLFAASTEAAPRNAKSALIGSSPSVSSVSGRFGNFNLFTPESFLDKSEQGTNATPLPISDGENLLEDDSVSDPTHTCPVTPFPEPLTEPVPEPHRKLKRLRRKGDPDSAQSRVERPKTSVKKEIPPDAELLHIDDSQEPINTPEESNDGEALPGEGAVRGEGLKVAGMYDRRPDSEWTTVTGFSSGKGRVQRGQGSSDWKMNNRESDEGFGRASPGFKSAEAGTRKDELGRRFRLDPERPSDFVDEDLERHVFSVNGRPAHGDRLRNEQAEAGVRVDVSDIRYRPGSEGRDFFGDGHVEGRVFEANSEPAHLDHLRNPNAGFEANEQDDVGYDEEAEWRRMEEEDERERENAAWEDFDVPEDTHGPRGGAPGRAPRVEEEVRAQANDATGWDPFFTAMDDLALTSGSRPSLGSRGKWGRGGAEFSLEPGSRLSEEARVKELLRRRLPHFRSVDQLQTAGGLQGEPVYIDYRAQFGDMPRPPNVGLLRRPAVTPSQGPTGKNSVGGQTPSAGRGTQREGRGAGRRKSHTAAPASSPGDVGHWTVENGKKVYISKTGKTMWGKLAYLQSMKDSGTLNKKKVKAPSAPKKGKRRKRKDESE
eukprot:TRINITY_DN1646_c0_g2_i1.p1 TRINITY_DN1646_c0_g2~~TRINITY_DN1646_c0_g2_i1.p1  ORF type:complete len:1182 (+),score=175.20 TRINITY_DN1646_c0_g2_i1:2-3547(+)